VSLLTGWFCKRAQWDAKQDLDWSIEIDPSRPLIDEDAFGFKNLPFFRALPKKKQEAFRANVTAYQFSQFLHGPGVHGGLALGHPAIRLSGAALGTPPCCATDT
jgi:hypothetical protein